MMRILEFTAEGIPAPQGSKSGFSTCYQHAQFCTRCKHRHLVKVNQTEVSKRVKPWRDAVAAAATAAMPAGWVPIGGPVILRVVFTMPRPKSHWRSGKSAHLLKPSSPLVPVSPPDLSKLVRSTEDALTTSRVWADDSMVVTTVAEKVYVGDTHVRTLGVPGAWVSVQTIEMQRNEAA